MRRFLPIFLFVATLLVSFGCQKVEEYGIVKEITIVATSGSIEETSADHNSFWRSGEQIRVFSTVSPTPARFTLISGADSNVATFNGTINTQASYWGVRPAEALQTTSSQSIVISTSEVAVDWNVEKVLAKTPQLGRTSGKNKLDFAPIFGVVAIPISLNNAHNVESVEVLATPDCHALYGTYGYDLNTKAVVTNSGTREATVTFDQPKTVGSTPELLYIALPQGHYSNLQITLAVGNGGCYSRFTAKNFNITEAEITEITNPEVSTISFVVGDWRLTSFCGTAADVNVFISIKGDNTFTLYQSADKLGYTTFKGEWAHDEATSILSGSYSDITAWGASYYASLTESGDLCLTNTANSEEVSIYTKSEMPTVSSTDSRAVNVKPFL